VLSAAVGLAVVLAVPIYRHVDSGDSHSRPAAHGRHDDIADEDTMGVAYGSTPGQVARQLGRPTETSRGCWVYRGQPGSIRGRAVNSTVDAFKFCFGPGPTGGTVVSRVLQQDAGSHRWGVFTVVARP